MLWLIFPLKMFQLFSSILKTHPLELFVLNRGQGRGKRGLGVETVQSQYNTQQHTEDAITFVAFKYCIQILLKLAVGKTKRMLILFSCSAHAWIISK